MAYDIKDIGKVRKRLGLTQTELSRSAGVSQSLLAKLERGTVEVSYSKAMAIFQALENVEKKEQLTAKDLMATRIVTIKPDDTVLKAGEVMKEKEISQLPVVSKGIFIGSISDHALLDAIREGYDRVAMSKLKVEEMMEDALPTISEKATLDEVSTLLEHNQAVLVAEKGKVVGIIAKIDLLKAVSRH